MWKLLFGIIGLLVWTCSSTGGMMAQESVDNLKAYPPAAPGMTRFVLHLDPQDYEARYRIELLIGQSVVTDDRNHYFFAGKLTEESIPGWGFPYFQLKELGPMAGTLIGADPNAPKVKRFITLGGEPQLFRYNSRLPIVIYVPAGCEVRYRVWKAEAESKAMNPG